MKLYLNVIFVLFLCVSKLVAMADKGPYDWAYIHLDGVRDIKVKQLCDFCDRIHQQAQNVRTDTVMINFFDLNRKYIEASKETVPPAEVAGKIQEVKNAFEEHYIRNWLTFYDILFVDMRGDVFFSIRKEPDCGTNLFDQKFQHTPLAQCLMDKPESEKFVDFHFYGVSQEPTSFFVEPAYKDGTQIGWIVLRFAINKINSLFAGTQSLGETNEAIVVNRQGFMLTESNFVSDESILKTKLDDCNIEPKFLEGSGNRVVVDYRGFKVLTSFEVVEFLGAKWLVVVKMDEAQITTEHFKQHQGFYNGRIIEYLKNSYVTEDKNQSVVSDDAVVRQVDMDEFVRARNNEMLQTMGVSTCTAVIASYPGKFGYLAHVSPLDNVYGGNATDLVGSIVKKIKTYDIYKYERRYVHFVIIARHLNSLQAIIEKLTAEDFLLSQISVMYHPQAEYARVMYDYSGDHLGVTWVTSRDTGTKCMQDAKCSYNIGEIVKDCIGRRQKQYANESNIKEAL